MRTYRGTWGEPIFVPEATIAPAPELHSETEAFPFAALAVRLGAQRDRFARAASFSTFFVDAIERPDIQSILAA
jgi:hypothetical protein